MENKGIIIILGVLFVIILIIVNTKPPYCNEAPYDYKCVCPEGYEKYAVGFNYSLKTYEYGCRKPIPEKPYSFPMNVTRDNYENPEVRGEMLAYAKDTIKNHCPSCDTIDCGDERFTRYELYYGNRPFVSVECLSQTTDTGGKSWWRVVFYLDNGEFHEAFESYCFPKDESNKCIISSPYD